MDFHTLAAFISMAAQQQQQQQQQQQYPAYAEAGIPMAVHSDPHSAHARAVARTQARTTQPRGTPDYDAATVAPRRQQRPGRPAETEPPVLPPRAPSRTRPSAHVAAVPIGGDGAASMGSIDLSLGSIMNRLSFEELARQSQQV
jgi:hypothetical protein